MKLQQLRYALEVSRQDLSVTQAAQTLHTSQPGISKQIRQLERELGVELFARSGKHLTRVTPAGEAILDLAAEVLRKVDDIRRVGNEFGESGRGSLVLATTHTQSRYVLPPVIRRFIDRYPGVDLHMHQGDPTQISRFAADGVADFAIATEALTLFRDLVMLPCYQWNRSVLVPVGHPLADPTTALSLEAMARFPIVTYTADFTGRSKVDAAFLAQGLAPRVVFTAADADVIKTYVRLGLGIGIVARMAYDPDLDHDDLVMRDAAHLFQPSVTSIGFRRDSFMPGYMYDFIEMFAPHLTRKLVEEALSLHTAAERASLFSAVDIPVM